jgi:hypothetical protein
MMGIKLPMHLNLAQPVMEKAPLAVLPVVVMVHTLAGVVPVRATRSAQKAARYPVHYVMAVEKQVVPGVMVTAHLHAAGAVEAVGSTDFFGWVFFFNAGLVFGMLSIKPFLKPVYPFTAYHCIGR